MRRVLELLMYLASPLALIITSPILAQGLGAEDRGQLGLAQAAIALAVSCGSLGQSELLLSVRNTQRGSYAQHARVALISATVTSAAAGAALVAIGLPTSVVVAAVLLTPIQAQVALWRAVVVKQQSFMRPAGANATSALLRVTILPILMVAGLLSLGSAYVAIQGSLIVGAIIFMGVRARRAREEIAAGGVSSWQLVRAGSPLVVFNLFTTITLNANLFFLNGRVSAYDLGVFAAATALTTAVLSISGAFKTRIQGALQSANRRARYHRELLLTSVIASVGAASAVVMSPLLVAVLLGPGYESAVGVMRLLGVASGALVIMDCMHGAMAVLVTRRTMVVVSFCGAVSLSIASLLLVPSMGIIGAAVATLVGYGVVAVVGATIVERSLLIPEGPACDV